MEKTALRKALETTGDGAALLPYDLESYLGEELMKVQPLAELIPVLQAESKTHEYNLRTSPPMGWFEGESTPANFKNGTYARKSTMLKIQRIWGSVTGFARSMDEAFIDAFTTELEGSLQGMAVLFEFGILYGRAEFVITSDLGIGVLKHDGQRWRQVVVAPNDTWFGGWRYNASVNVGKDRHQGVGKFTGGAAHEILLISSWGIGVLAQAGTTLHSPVIQPNGARFGGWLFDSRANQIVGIGDVDGDGRDEIVITSTWGIGVLGALGNTFYSLMLAPNGTRFGGWLLNTADNRFGPLGDFDGDGCGKKS